MSRLLSRIITSSLLFTIGAGIIFFASSALIRSRDWIMTVMCISIVIIGVAFLAAGLAAAKGTNIKEMMASIFSGISF